MAEFFAATRRATLIGALAGAGMSVLPGLAQAAVKPRARVIVDNDFAGDPDGLFQLAHHLLCPSVAIPLVVGSHLHPGESWSGGHAAAAAAAKAAELIRLIAPARAPAVIAGTEAAIGSRPNPSAATEMIVREAMRDDPLPLFYCAGAGLTELALAWRAEPRIGKRLKLVWIGGNEHPGLAEPPPGPPQPEYNFTIDPVAAQTLFGDSDIEIWQVPRDGYRQMLIGLAEIRAITAQAGALGRWLQAQLDTMFDRMGDRLAAGETYVLGDSPLVTLTALQTLFEPDAASSRFALRPTPRILPNGGYAEQPGARPMRVYTQIDTRLTFGDMAAKFRELAARERR